MSNVCESLLRIDADFAVQPNLAESFANPDPLTWVYRLRSGVTFHDGTPMTAEDVVFSLNRHRDPELGSYWSTAFSKVKDVTATGALRELRRLPGDADPAVAVDGVRMACRVGPGRGRFRPHRDVDGRPRR